MAELTQVLRSEIIRCEIPPGSVVVENELVQKYDTTKARVRTALRTLAHEGFLEAIPRMGHFVTMPTQREVDEIFELRGLLEGWAAREAAGRIAAGEIAELRALDVSVSSQDPESFNRSLRANRTFHLRIAEIAGNCLMTELLGNLLDRVHRMLHMGLIAAAHGGDMVDDHLCLIDALEAHDARTAERVSRRQIKQARSMIERAVDAYRRDAKLAMPRRR